MRIGNPLPTNLPQECKKATRILKSFVNASDGLDGLIPSHVLRSAHGFAIFTVVKAGFLMSVRAGTGLVIARLPSGDWSAPSAIGTGGMGFGGQAGAEVTEFILVLNSRAAIRQFMSAGSITLGGNMSVALGPIGRNAEGSGSLNSKGKLAAMYSYSKTKGVFAGISVEGSAIVERQDCNVKSYGNNVTATKLLSGQIEPPHFATELIQILASRAGSVTEYIHRPSTSSQPEEFDNHSISQSPFSPPSVTTAFPSQTDSYLSNQSSPERGTYAFGRSNPFASSGQASQKPATSKISFNPASWRTKSDKTGSDTQRTGLPSTWVHTPRCPSQEDLWANDDPFHEPSQHPPASLEAIKPIEIPPNSSSFGDLEPLIFGQIKQEITPITERNGFNHSTTPDLARLSFSSTESSHEQHHPSRSSPTRTQFIHATSTRLGASAPDDLISFNEPAPPLRSQVLGVTKAAYSSSDIFHNNTHFGLDESSTRSLKVKEAGVSKAVNETDFLVGTVMPSVRRTNTESVGLLGNAVALYDFSSNEEGDLSFQKGDTIKIVAKTDDEWWTGSIGMRKGIFPKNRVQIDSLS